MKPHQFNDAVIRWYHQYGRKNLPWQQQCSPYRVWVSEIMLQQTQVTTVIPYYERFMQRFPDILSLAGAKLDEVLHYWSGLGYYARARNLHKTAIIINNKYKGKFPQEFELVAELPGIGRSTAGAILSLACGQRHAILDGNVKRVLARYFMINGWPGSAKTLQQLWDKAEQLTPGVDVNIYNQAMMDLGSGVCTRSKPTCSSCPVYHGCKAFSLQKQKEYPNRKSKKSIPVRETRMVLLRNNNNAVLLQRRPPVGIWGGLLSFPEMSPDQSITQWCQSNLGVDVIEYSTWPVLRHTFSHFHLDITPVLAGIRGNSHVVMDQDHWVWYKEDMPEPGGLAAPVKRLISELVSSNFGESDIVN